MAVAASKMKSVQRVLYLMDPPALVSNGYKTKFRTRTLGNTLVHQDTIISTPFIFEALKKHQIELDEISCIQSGFPLIQPQGQTYIYQQKKYRKCY